MNNFGAVSSSQSEKMYRSMLDSMNLLQATRSDILKIFDDSQNQSNAQDKNECASDSTFTVLGSGEKKRKQLLKETIYKIRLHVDELERISRMF